MKPVRRMIVILLALCLLTPALAHPTSAEALSGKLTISVEAWMVEKYNMLELAKRFMEANPGTEVEVITHEGLGAAYSNLFLQWAQTGQSTADLYFGGLTSQLASAMIDDLLLPWDDFLVDDIAPDKWIPAYMQSAYVEGPSGTNYPTIPGLGETMNFQYNVNHFKAAGFVDANGDPVTPKTYEELETFACKLAEMEVSGKKLLGLEMEYNVNFAPDTWMAAVVAAEGTYLTEDGKPNWDSPAGKAWIEFQKRIIDRGCGGTSVFTDNNGARNALKAGQAAIINASNSRSNEGTNALCPEQGQVPCPSGEVIQMFSYPGEGGVIAFSHQVYIPRVAKNVELARAFTREALLSEYGQTWSAIQWGKMPTIWANYDALPENVNFAHVRKELEGPAQGQWQYKDGQLLRQTYVDELQRYLVGDQTLDEMIENLKDVTASADLTLPKDRQLQ